ncbi:PREDICTED: uncharacterized protein LOC105567200 isoform X2 [Vollenhovia emeryi]|nr:PREDICTED: uncharacterized protein LOC105567200 isoform X2 [Vollenhovia emeryi]
MHIVCARGRMDAERNVGHRSRETGYKHLLVTIGLYGLSTGVTTNVYGPVRANDVQLGTNKAEHCYSLRVYMAVSSAAVTGRFIDRHWDVSVALVRLFMSDVRSFR